MQGHEYRSLNSYRSAISSIHDGVEVSKHALLTRMLKGAINQRPPRLKYNSTLEYGQNVVNV